MLKFRLSIVIEVDGNINKETAPVLKSSGASYFVLGISALFNKELGSLSDKANQVIESISN